MGRDIIDSELIEHQRRLARAKAEGKPNHDHAWRGMWNRPVHIDEDTQHPFTIARMTDHNVKGSD